MRTVRYSSWFRTFRNGRHQPALARRPRPLGGVRQFACGRSCLVFHQARRVRGAGRRIRLRQIRQCAVDPEAAAVSERLASVGQHPLPRPGPADGVRERDARNSRQRHLDHLSGADDLAQSAAHHRGADPRDTPAAQRHQRRDGAGANAGTADAGRHSRARNPAEQLSASIVGRPAPARHDRDGARQRAGPVDRGRADHRARRHGAGADPGVAG